eukprot:7149715-Prymnesium_polylepis.1
MSAPTKACMPTNLMKQHTSVQHGMKLQRYELRGACGVVREMANAAPDEDPLAHAKRLMEQATATMDYLRKRVEAAGSQQPADSAVANVWRKALACTGCTRQQPKGKNGEQQERSPL